MNLEPGESQEFHIERPKRFKRGVLELAWTCAGCGRDQTLSVPVEPMIDDIELNIACCVCDAPPYLKWTRAVLYALGAHKK